MARPKVHDEKLRARLLERAAALVSDGGADALSLRTLARDCETSTTAVYALFGGKNGLLTALFDDAFDQLGRRIGMLAPSADALDDVVRTALAYRDTALDDPHQFALMFSGPTLLSPEAARTDGVGHGARAAARGGGAGRRREGAPALTRHRPPVPHPVDDRARLGHARAAGSSPGADGRGRGPRPPRGLGSDGPEQAVPGVAEAGDDVGGVVEPLVDGGGDHPDRQAASRSRAMPSGAASAQIAVTSVAPRS